MKYIRTYKIFERFVTISNFSSKQLEKLPELPPTLKELICTNNNLTTLPELPQNLEKLYCQFNYIEFLPELPKTLITLNCGRNRITSLPSELPPNLKILQCKFNNWEEPIKKEYIEKFKMGYI